MKPGVAFALLVSVLLVGTAVWMSGGGVSKPTPTISGSNNSEGLSGTFNTEAFLNAANNSELSSTGVVSRQLILDYVNLASNGQATETNLNSLIERYVNYIPSISTATKIDSTNLKIVEDSKVNFQNYDTVTTQIEKEKQVIINTAYKKLSNNLALNPEFYSLSHTIGSAYEEAATKFRNIPVPNSLASAHVKLVNNYLSSASAMKSLAETERDAMAAFAGMVTLNSNTEEENVIISEIVSILIKNGV